MNPPTVTCSVSVLIDVCHHTTTHGNILIYCDLFQRTLGIKLVHVICTTELRNLRLTRPIKTRGVTAEGILWVYQCV